MRHTVGILVTIIAHQHQFVARYICTVDIATGFALAMNALTDVFGFVAKAVGHAIIKDVQSALPKAIIAIFFTVLHDATIDLVNLFKAAVFINTLSASQRIPPVQ